MMERQPLPARAPIPESGLGPNNSPPLRSPAVFYSSAGSGGASPGHPWRAKEGALRPLYTNEPHTLCTDYNPVTSVTTSAPSLAALQLSTTTSTGTLSPLRFPAPQHRQRHPPPSPGPSSRTSLHLHLDDDEQELTTEFVVRAGAGRYGRTCEWQADRGS